MLRGLYEGGIEKSSSLGQACKPDYEGMIKRLKEQREEVRKFYEAALQFTKSSVGMEFTRRQDGSVPFVEMIGALVIRMHEIQREIEGMIERFEQDS